MQITPDTEAPMDERFFSAVRASMTLQSMTQGAQDVRTTRVDSIAARTAEALQRPLSATEQAVCHEMVACYQRGFRKGSETA